MSSKDLQPVVRTAYQVVRCTTVDEQSNAIGQAQSLGLAWLASSASFNVYVSIWPFELLPAIDTELRPLITPDSK